MSFINDYAKILKEQFGFPYSLSDDAVLMDFLNKQKLILPTKKWNVHKAHDLTFKQPKNIKIHLAEIERKATAGESLNSHHSIQVNKHLTKDSLLFDWGIFHLHPGHGDKKTKNDFVNRSNELLFVFANNNDLYFICVGTHNSFTDISILEKLCTEWPKVLDSHKTSIIPSYSLKNDEQISKARCCNTNYIIEICGNYYIPPGNGVTVSGHSSDVTDSLIYLKYDLEKTEQTIKNEYKKIINSIHQDENNNYEFELIEKDHNIFIVKELKYNKVIYYDINTNNISLQFHK